MLRSQSAPSSPPISGLRSPSSGCAIVDSDAATDLNIDLGFASSVRDDVAAEKRASRNRASNRSLTPAPASDRDGDGGRAVHGEPSEAPHERPAPARDEAVDTGVVIVLSAMFLIGALALASVLGVVTALAATLIV